MSQQVTDYGIAPLYHTYDQPKPLGWYFDEDKARESHEWICSLRQHQGKWAGQTLGSSMLPWERRIILEIFGWYKPDGYRGIRSCYLETGRKQGKTTLAAAIGLYLAFDGEQGPQIYFAATDKDQAKLAYSTAREMVLAHPGRFGEFMPDGVQVYQSTHEMKLMNNPGGIIKALSSEVRKLLGLNSHGIIFDEVAFLPDRQTWDALVTSMDARQQPLLLAVTTAGWNRESIAFEQHQYTQNIMEGAVNDPSFLGVVYGASEEDDWTDEAVWMKAAPSMGTTTTIERYRIKYEASLAKPTEQNAFRTLLLSQWVGQASRWIDMTYFDAITDDIEIPNDTPVWLGLDLASTQDLCALAVIADVDDKWICHVFQFLPGKNDPELIRQLGFKSHAPYEVWAKDEWLTLTDGRTTNQNIIKAKINECAKRWNVQGLVYDRWGAHKLVQELEEDGMTIVRMGQGFASMSGPAKELEAAIIDGRFIHQNNPVLRWELDHCSIDMDPSGNIKPNKDKSTFRIDAVYAICDALEGCLRNKTTDTTSAYDTDQDWDDAAMMWA